MAVGQHPEVQVDRLAPGMHLHHGFVRLVLFGVCRQHVVADLAYLDLPCLASARFGRWVVVREHTTLSNPCSAPREPISSERMRPVEVKLFPLGIVYDGRQHFRIALDDNKSLPLQGIPSLDLLREIWSPYSVLIIRPRIRRVDEPCSIF